jgi:hypothetical protein
MNTLSLTELGHHICPIDLSHWHMNHCFENILLPWALPSGPRGTVPTGFEDVTPYNVSSQKQTFAQAGQKWSQTVHRRFQGPRVVLTRHLLLSTTLVRLLCSYCCHSGFLRIQWIDNGLIRNQNEQKAVCRSRLG